LGKGGIKRRASDLRFAFLGMIRLFHLRGS
jgi:hypothetical protein